MWCWHLADTLQQHLKHLSCPKQERSCSAVQLAVFVSLPGSRTTLQPCSLWLTQYKPQAALHPLTLGLHLLAFSSCSYILKSQLSAFIITGKHKIILHCYFFFLFIFEQLCTASRKWMSVVSFPYLEIFPFRDIRVWKLIWLYSIEANRIQIKSFMYFVFQDVLFLKGKLGAELFWKKKIERLGKKIDTSLNN